MKFTRPNDRIIVALDVPGVEPALELVGCLNDRVGGFKIGFELIYSMLADMVTFDEETATGAFRKARELFNLLIGLLFLDGKLKDIENTMVGGAKAILRLKPKSFNIHLTPSVKAVKAVAALLGPLPDPRPQLWGVTMLTDMTEDDLTAQGLMVNHAAINAAFGDTQSKLPNMSRVVAMLARLGQSNGTNGVICSAQEAKIVREICGPDFTIATPGIRPRWAAKNDQERITTPTDALLNGSNIQIIGRPISKPPGGQGKPGTPEEAVDAICEEIYKAT